MTVPTITRPPRTSRPQRPALLTAPEVCAILGIELKTLYNWRTAGRGPRATRVGKYLRYDPVDVEAYIDAQREQTAAGERAA